MAGKSTRDDRYSWKKGDVIITDRNGKPVDPRTLDDKPAKKPATKSKKK